MRVIIESWAFQDPRLFMLMDELGADRRQCLGLLLDVWYGTQEAHLVKAPRKMIRALCRPEGAAWTAEQALSALIGVGYLVDAGDGLFHVRGNDKPVAKMAAAKASAHARWDSLSSDMPPPPSSHDGDDANAMRTQCERNANAMLTKDQGPRTKDQDLDTEEKADAPLPPAEAPPRKVSKFKFEDGDMKAARWLQGSIRRLNPMAVRIEKANLDKWANEVRLMREVDGLEYEDIARVMTWALEDPFWRPKITGPEYVRTKWDTLSGQMMTPPARRGSF